MKSEGEIDCLDVTDQKKNGTIKSLYAPFQYLNGSYIRLSALCNCRKECGENGDEYICPWAQNYSYGVSLFTCMDGMCLMQVKQCDGVIDSQPQGEDEWFCDLRYQKIEHVSLQTLEALPVNNVQELCNPIG